MPIDLSVVEGDYFQDLLNQPKALQDTFDRLEPCRTVQPLIARLHRGKFKSVILTGMGSSVHALNPLLLQLTGTHIPVVLVETSELIYYRRSLLDPRSLAVVVSQSGRSAEIVRLLEVNRGRAPIIAVTNTANSPLARRSEAAILTEAGEEFSVSCKTYVTALLALRFLGDRLCGVPAKRTQSELRSVVSPVTHYVAAWKDHVLGMVPLMEGIRHLVLAGRGPSLAAVETGALILKESTQFPAEGMSSAAFRHGPFEMLSPETFVLVFEGATRTQALNKRLFDDIQQRRGRAGYLAQSAGPNPFAVPKVDPGLLPIVEILPVQMLTLALAVLSRRTPGQFRFATKITSTE
jgi:glucosamine--fructose-6-phosphate aminotransferase (isomerizing)